ELTSASNPKAEIEEAESYNNVTSEVVNDLAQKDGKLETRNTDIHPKIVMPLNNKAFVDWATQGVSHKGKEVEYRLNTGKYADRRALDIYNRKKAGQPISDTDNKYMIDNLA